VSLSKSLYARSLHNLEEISESIHEQRATKNASSSASNRLSRQPGVGAELTSLPSFDLDECDVVVGASSEDSSSVATGGSLASFPDASSRASASGASAAGDEEEGHHGGKRFGRAPLTPAALTRSASCPVTHEEDALSLAKESEVDSLVDACAKIDL